MGKKKNTKQRKKNNKREDLPEGQHLVSLSSLISNFIMFYLEDNKIELVVEDTKSNRDMSLRDFEYGLQAALDKFIVDLKKVPIKLVIELENENKDTE